MNWYWANDKQPPPPEPKPSIFVTMSRCTDCPTYGCNSCALTRRPRTWEESQAQRQRILASGRELIEGTYLNDPVPVYVAGRQIRDPRKATP